MKRTFYYSDILFALTLCSTIIFSSCATNRQVACPEFETGNQLVQLDYRKNVSMRNSGKDLSSGISRRKIVKASEKYRRENISAERQMIVSAGESGDSLLMSILPGQIEINQVPDPHLLASTTDLTAYRQFEGADNQVIAEILAEKDINEQAAEMSGKETRQFKRAFKKELKSAFNQASGSSNQDGYEKPAIGFAIASLVLGLLAFGGIPFIGSLLAIIFGAIALKRIRRDPSLEGRGMAIAGIVLGIIGIFFALILAIVGIAIGVLSLLFFWV
jgi:hypothetical protein